MSNQDAGTYSPVTVPRGAYPGGVVKDQVMGPGSAGVSPVPCSTDGTGETPALPDNFPPGVCTLDHDGCVVCADAGIPVRVLSIDGDDALCQDMAGNRATIAVELVAPVRDGDVLLTHGGVAIGRVEG